MPTLTKIKKILAILMESPLYLTMPPPKRLELVKYKQQESADKLRSSMLDWIKTGKFHHPPYPDRF
jgi:hypothetical protein